MAFTSPTASDLKTRFPAFAAVADATITTAIDEANLVAADDSWIDEDNYQLGAMLYAAHVLTLDGFGTGAEAQSAASGTLGYAFIKSGDLTLWRERRQAGESSTSPESLYMRTLYGQRYLQILRRNRPAILVLNGT